MVGLRFSCALGPASPLGGGGDEVQGAAICSANYYAEVFFVVLDLSGSSPHKKSDCRSGTKSYHIPSTLNYVLGGLSRMTTSAPIGYIYIYIYHR